ncbi:MAG: YbhB/YbcL family Raf kinase inhibitor-like protein [Oculatellaceae cyanobacterium Prado106]|nr:YbhB/YbcL family Raf kinase inhibitor-like protein [Oculatellaceae cyanobacterium Prado106]
MSKRVLGRKFGWRGFQRTSLAACLMIGLLGLGACAPQGNSGAIATPAAPAVPVLKVTSEAFEAEGMIPVPYTCKGEGRSPALSWDAPPPGTQSWVVRVEDPDAPGKTFVHWVLYDLPPEIRQLPAALPATPFLNEGGMQGKNDFGRYGYGAPCPPSGTHRYVFQVYALDKFLDLAPGVSQAEVTTAVEGHILAQGSLVGKFGQR